MSIQHANHAAVAFYGYSLSELQQMRIFDLQQDKNSHIPIKDWEKNSETGVYMQVAFHKKRNGVPVLANIYFNASSAGSAWGQVTVVDVTNNLTLQQTAAADKERYRVFIEQSSEGIYRQELIKPMPINIPFEQGVAHIKENLVVAECNVAMAEMYGYNHPSQLVGATAAQLIDFTDAANINYFKAFADNGFKITDAESHEKDKNGLSRYFLNNAIGIIEDGCLLRIWGTQRDITERKSIEEKIKFLANLVEETSDVLTAADLEFIPVTWNKAAEKTYGINAAQAIGNNIRNYIDIRYNKATREEVREIIKEKGAWRGETYFQHPLSGKQVTLLSTFKLLLNEKGAPLGYVVAGTDITERKDSESKLKESEQRFRTMADSAPVMIWMADAHNRLTYMNKPMLEYTGLNIQAYNLTWASLLHPDDEEKSTSQFKESFQKMLPVTLIYRIKNGRGKYRWVQDSGTPRFLEDNTFVGFIGSIVDIHDTKIKEESLQYQATVLENVLDIIVTTDLDFKVITWNIHAEEVYGYTQEEMVGKQIGAVINFEFIGDSRKEIYRKFVKHHFWKGEVCHTNKKGKKKYFVHTLTYVYNKTGHKIGVLSMARDISDRKAAERKLQESETFYRTLISDALDGMLLINPEGIISFVSPSIRHILNFEPEEVQGKNAFEFVHPEDFNWAVQSLAKEIQQNPEYKSIVIRLRKKDGTWLWCMVRGHNLIDNPYIQSIAIYFHDDTLRKKAGDLLKESEQRFRNLIRDLQVGVLVNDAGGTIIMSNNAMYKMWHLTEEQLLGHKIWELFTDAIKEDGTPFKKEERPVFRAMLTKALVRNVVMGVKNPKTGKPIWMLINADPIITADGELQTMVCSLMDITERKKLEDKLIAEQIGHQKSLTQATIDGQEKERREIGKELHDNIGQQLTTTKLFLDMALSTANLESQEMISMALRNISDLINEVRGISRALTPPTLGDLGLIDSIYDLIETIEKTQTFAIELDVAYFSERNIPENKKLMLFRIIQEQLNNIIKHSAAQQVHITLNNEDENIKLVITDNGKGFDTVQSKIGLGLTNIRNRTELFGGAMSLQTSLGKGCTLTVDIPVS